MNTATIEDIAARLVSQREEAARVRKDLEPMQARINTLQEQLTRLAASIAAGEAQLRDAVRTAHREESPAVATSTAGDSASEAVDVATAGEIELQVMETSKTTLLRHLHAAGEVAVDYLVDATRWHRSSVLGQLYRLRDEGVVQNEGELWRVVPRTATRA